MAGKTAPNFTITGLDKIADPNPVPENAPKLTSPLLSEADVTKAAMSGKVQVIGPSGMEYVEPSERPDKSRSGGGILSSISNTVSSAGSAITEAVKPVSVNTEQLNMTPNLDQDLTKIDVGSPNLNQSVNLPILNTDQDLTKVSVKGLQESAVKQAGEAQDALITIGTDIQAGAVDIGKAGQEALVQAGKTGQEALVQAGTTAQEAVVQAGKATQEQAVQTATQVSGGQKNETLEAVANNTTKATENVISTATKGTELATSILTKGVETQVQQGTNYVEEKVMPVVVDAAKFYTENYPAVKLVQETVHEFEKLTPSIEMMGSFDLAGGGSVQDTSDPNIGDSQLSADSTNPGDDKVFGDLEKATGKDSKLTEEERLRRIRRLLLNRYGRENTILTTGPGDTRSRRRYAI